MTVGGWMALIRAAVFKLQQNSFHVCSLHQHETFSNKFLPQISVNSCCLSYNSDTCSIFSFGWHRNGSFCQLFAQRCAACVWVCVCVCVCGCWCTHAGALREPEVVVNGRFHLRRFSAQRTSCRLLCDHILSSAVALCSSAGFMPHLIFLCSNSSDLLLQTHEDPNLLLLRYSNRNELISLYKVENLS